MSFEGSNMAPLNCPSPAPSQAPSSEPRYEDLRAKIDLRIHVKPAHWTLQKRSCDAIRDQLDKFLSKSQRPSDRMQRLIVDQIPRLRRYAHFLLRDPQAADDLVQDTLVRAVAAIDTWRPDSNMRAWLFMIMKNVMRNDFRRASNGDVYLGPELDNHPGAAMEGNQESHVTLIDLQNALNQLSGEFKQVLLLAGVEGFRYEEIAMILGVPVGTVRSRLSRGRSLLRAQMAGTRPTTSCATAADSAREE
jgi:RNA polymerase sigma-70 factor (ECF subfamily)